jgi:hypothetical protein
MVISMMVPERILDNECDKHRHTYTLLSGGGESDQQGRGAKQKSAEADLNSGYTTKFRALMACRSARDSSRGILPADYLKRP